RAGGARGGSLRSPLRCWIHPREGRAARARRPAKPVSTGCPKNGAAGARPDSFIDLPDREGLLTMRGRPSNLRDLWHFFYEMAGTLGACDEVSRQFSGQFAGRGWKEQPNRPERTSERAKWSGGRDPACGAGGGRQDDPRRRGERFENESCSPYAGGLRRYP